MSPKVRRCEQCDVRLPRGAGSNRRYCTSTCRSRAWRRRRRYWTTFRAAVASGLDILDRVAPASERYVAGRCPACGWQVPLRKRRDAVFCSPRCRTRAWRARRAVECDASERPSQEASPRDA